MKQEDKECFDQLTIAISLLHSCAEALTNDHAEGEVEHLLDEVRLFLVAGV